MNKEDPRPLGVTAIKSIDNLHTTLDFEIKNLTNPGDNIEVGHGQKSRCNMWIPWCTSLDDFRDNKKISVEPKLSGVPASLTIWQNGDYVWYCKTGKFTDGTLVPGNSTVNGDRSVEITGTDISDVEIKFY